MVHSIPMTKATPIHQALRALLLLPLLLLASACGPEVVKEVDKEAIGKTLESYATLLAAAYSSGDAESLKALAAEKEVARVFTRVSELAEEGKYVEAIFYELTLENVVVWSHSNAYATTLEVWDLNVRARGSDALLGQQTGQRSRVKYQLQRRGDSWQILNRELDQAIQ